MDIIIIIAVLLLFFFIAFKSKRITPATVVFVCGALKTGKTQLTLWQAYKDYQIRYRAWWLQYIFGKAQKKTKPVFYTNVQLNLPKHVRVCWLTDDHILRKTRLAYNCTTFIDEAAFVARSSDWADKEVSDTLTDFVKLYAHETFSGSLYIDSQNFADLHHSFRRCITTYYFIHHTTKFAPLYSIMHFKEMVSDPINADQSLDRISGTGRDVDMAKSLGWTLCPKKVWKWYDRHTYSCLTDDLPLDCTPQERKDSLKTPKILRVKFTGKGKKGSD